MSSTEPQSFLNETQRAALQKAEREEHLKTRKYREASSLMGGGAGPETMTSDDYETLFDLRRQIWTSGFRGFLTGGVVGAVGSVVFPMLQQHNILKIAFKLEPKHRTGAIITLSALGMFLGASATGQQNSWRMTNIYSRGATPQLTRYQKIMAGKELEEEYNGVVEEPLGQWNGTKFDRVQQRSKSQEKRMWDTVVHQVHTSCLYCNNKKVAQFNNIFIFGKVLRTLLRYNIIE